MKQLNEKVHLNRMQVYRLTMSFLYYEMYENLANIKYFLLFMLRQNWGKKFIYHQGNIVATALTQVGKCCSCPKQTQGV